MRKSVSSTGASTGRTWTCAPRWHLRHLQAFSARTEVSRVNRSPFSSTFPSFSFSKLKLLDLRTRGTFQEDKEKYEESICEGSRVFRCKHLTFQKENDGNVEENGERFTRETSVCFRCLDDLVDNAVVSAVEVFGSGVVDVGAFHTF